MIGKDTGNPLRAKDAQNLEDLNDSRLLGSVELSHGIVTADLALHRHSAAVEAYFSQTGKPSALYSSFSSLILSIATFVIKRCMTLKQIFMVNTLVDNRV